jgi:large subunit ribosomal protein L25
MAKTKSTAQQILTVRRRSILGSRPVDRLRSEGIIPGVVYGRGVSPIAVAVEHQALTQVLHARAGEHALLTLRIEDTKPWEKPVLIKDIQHDAVSGRVLHVDFQAIALTERIRVKIPVILQGEPVGVKQDGGVLEHFLREIEVECLPTDIPEGVTFDISAMKIGDTVHVRDLTASRQAKILHDPDGAIASVQAPKEEKAEEAAAAVTEPEVLREKKEAVEPGAGEGKAEAPARPPGPPGTRAGAGGGGEGRAGEGKKDAKADKEKAG